MKVILLCGGIGTRLKEETEFKPKPMVFIGGKPIVWHIMKIYAQYGFNEFILALGYKAEYVKEYFLNQKAFTCDFILDTATHKTSFNLRNRSEIDNFKITFVDTGLETQVGERILRCEKYIPKKDAFFMVTYGDGVADINIKNLLRFHKTQKTVGTITGVHPHSKYGLIELGRDKRVTSFVEKPILSDWVNGGFMVFNHSFFSYLKAGEMEHPALKRLAQKKQLSLYQHTGFWYCMDTYREVEELQALWKQSKPPWKIWT